MTSLHYVIIFFLLKHVISYSVLVQSGMPSSAMVFSKIVIVLCGTTAFSNQTSVYFIPVYSVSVAPHSTWAKRLLLFQGCLDLAWSFLLHPWNIHCFHQNLNPSIHIYAKMLQNLCVCPHAEPQVNFTLAICQSKLISPALVELASSLWCQPYLGTHPRFTFHMLLVISLNPC